jgi:hypothetical protein
MTAYDAPAYNNLPLFEHVQPTDPAALAKLSALGELLEKYDLGKAVGFALLHRHFDVTEGHVVIWKITDNRLIASIEKLDPEIHAPISWRVGEGGVLSPLEYLDTTSVLAGIAEQVLELGKGDAIIALGKATRFIGASEHFALSLLPTVIAHFATVTLGSDALERVAHESSDFRDLRSELTFPESAPDTAIPSLWVYRPKNGFIVLAGCSSSGCYSPPPKNNGP